MIATSMSTAVADSPASRHAVDRDDKWLCMKGRRFTARRDEVLFREGDDALSIHRIVSGAARVVKIMIDGRRYVVDFLLPGDFIGFDRAATYVFTAEATVDTEWICYSRASIDRELDENPATVRHLLELAWDRLAAAQGQMLLLGRMSAMERIATFLLDLERRLGRKNAAVPVVPLAMTRLDIADHLGLTLETVSRSLNQLKRLGIIELPHPQRICITNRHRLEGLASGACYHERVVPARTNWGAMTGAAAADAGLQYGLVAAKANHERVAFAAT